MIRQFVDDVRDLLAQTFGLDAEAYTSLTTVEDETCFVTKAGGLMSALHLRGHLRVVGAEELALLSDRLLSLLGSALAAGETHLVDLVFSSDPAQTPAVVRRLLAPAERTAARAGLDLRDLFAERARHLPAYTCAETVYLIVWTTPAGLPRATRRQSDRERRRELARLPVAPALGRDNQNPFATNRYLVDTHRSLVRTLLDDLGAAGFELAALPVAAAARQIRAECDPGWTPDDWRPLLPGTAPPAPRTRADGTLGAAGCWFPAFGQQLMPRGMKIVDDRTVRVGDRLYRPFYVDLPQLTETQRFERLLDRARRQGLPWRMAVRLSGGAAEWLAARRRWTGLLHFAGATNKLLDAAIQAMRRHLHEGHVGVLAQIRNEDRPGFIRQLAVHYQQEEIIMPTAPATARLEARINPEVHALLKRAAELQGRTLTDFVVSAAQDAARRTIEQTETIRLSLADQERFARALLAPPEPAPALRCAFARRRQLLDAE